MKRKKRKKIQRIEFQKEQALEFIKSEKGRPIFTWIFQIAVALALAAVVAAVIIHLIREKKRGKSSCGCHCAGCPMSGACHSRKT